MFKRILALILVLIMIMPLFSLPTTAATVEDKSDISTETSNDTYEEDLEQVEDIASFKCDYDIEAKRIKVSGTLDNSVFAEHSDWTLAVYAVPPGMSENDVIADPEAKALAETSVSIKFEFSFKVDEVIDRYSRYAIFLRSPSDEFLLTTEAQYPEVASSLEQDLNKNSYKGLSADFSSASSEINPGTTVISVYWDELFSENPSSMFYVVEDKQFFFDKQKIESLDVAIRSLSIAHSKVYLRLLKKADKSITDAEYVMPDVYDGEIIMQIHAAISFLAERYANISSGHISGFVIGKGWNASEKYNYTETFDTSEYADRCGTYAVVVANAARSVNSGLDIVLPIDSDAFATKGMNETSENSSKRLIRRILHYLDESFHSGMKISFSLDCAVTPLNITNDNLNDGIDLNWNDPQEKISAGAHYLFSTFLSNLSREYVSASEQFMFFWQPDSALQGKALAAAYVYSYYALFADTRVSAFIIDLSSERSKSKLTDLSYVMKHIDTAKGAEATRSLLSLFGKKEWSDIFSAVDLVRSNTENLIISDARVNVDTHTLGTFSYFDFAQTNLTDGWYAGINCDGVRVDYKEDSDKSLRSYFSFGDITDSGELQYIFSYSENMIYTPTLRFDFHIEDDLDASTYELKLILDSDEDRYEGRAIVKGNSATQVYFDVSQFVKSNTVEAMRISVRALDSEQKDCCMWLYSIVGCSSIYTSDQLTKLISDEREKVRNPDEQEQDNLFFGRMILAIGIIVITAALGLVIILGFTREERSGKERNENLRR